MNGNVQEKPLVNFNEKKDPLSFTDIASAKVKALMTENGDARLRIFVTGLGCHGAEFGFSFDQAATADDVDLKVSGIPLIVDSLTYPYLVGTEIDYTEHDENFVVRKPASESPCNTCSKSCS
jgi:iron-sulfur cluster insertion protein